MVQASPDTEVFFAVRLAETADPQARRYRSTQSAEATRLLVDLRSAASLFSGPQSKSHSRALSAAAVSRKGCIGVDVELIGAARDNAALSWFLIDGDHEPAVERLYRTWTFREAFYKAFGAFPDLAARRFVCRADVKDGESFRMGDASVLHARVADGFMLTLVWSGEGTVQAVSL
jgi:hypothetical protein